MGIVHPASSSSSSGQAQPVAALVALQKPAGTGVRVNTFIMNNPISTADFPALFNAAPAKPGYNTALEHYHEMRDFLQKHMYKFDRNQTVIVRATMMTNPPGRKTPVMVSVSRKPLF
jgi:hypothetical protein